MNKESARLAIAELVAEFKDYRAKNKIRNETEVSDKFVRPLFRLLGWDAKSDYSLEENVAGKFADIGYYIGGVPAFYVETKDVDKDIYDKNYMSQAINYSYLKGVTWAVLTDFETLMVFNAEVKEKDPKQSKFFELGFEDYTSDMGFEDLWLLSKESFMASPRLIDKRAERYNKKDKKVPVSEGLLAELLDWRRRLFREIRVQATTLWATDTHKVDNAIQKFFDRLIFIRTMEDRKIEESRLLALLRQNASRNKEAQLFPELLKMFRELDEIYNSNLFAEDRLDLLEVHDPILIKEIINGLYKGQKGYVQYDFEAISADVLGAVYEQYLGFKAQYDGEEDTASKNLKRKLQGIYYTPQYVVRYIVQQTLGRLLDDERDPLTLRVLDPACGSGAFLIEAFDVLRRAYIKYYPDMPIAEITNSILAHNLYGVDLDDQAVEVTRLNLSIRGAVSRQKLPNLTHIKHGNSLIADDNIAGENLGFDWAMRFPDVINAGGFDAVIGNPPYVRQETLGASFKGYAKEAYETYAGTADLYVYFVERGYNLLRDEGRMGYILPNKWMRANYGKKLRDYLKDKTESLVDFGDLPVFADATTYPCIINLHKGTNDDSVTTAIVQDLDFGDLDNYLQDKTFTVKRQSLAKAGWALVSEDEQALLDKLREKGMPLGEYVDKQIYYGIKTGLNEAFVIDDKTRDYLIGQDAKSAELIKPYLAGRDVKRYKTPESTKFLIFTRRGVRISDYPAIEEYLCKFKERLMPKPKGHKGKWGGRKAGKYQWYEIQDTVAYYEEFEKPKIIIPTIVTESEASIDWNVDNSIKNYFYSNDKTTIIGSDSYYLLAVLNSQTGNYFLQSISATRAGGYFEYKPMYLKKLPIPKLDLTQPDEKAQHDAIVAKVERMLKKQAEHQQLQTELDERRHEVAEEITRLDKEIDTLVYTLYDLTEDEIAIIEG